MSDNRESHIGPSRWSLIAFSLAWEFAISVTKGVGHALLSRHDVPPPAPSPRSEDDQRGSDRNLDPQRAIAAHIRRGTALVLCAFAVALAGGAGFLYVYWTSANHMLLGGTLALFWGGLGVSLVLYARWLMLDIQAEEPRERLASGALERESFAADFYGGARQIHRRGLLAWIAVTAVGLAAAAVVSLFRSLGTNPGAVLFSTVWKRGQRLADSDGRLISIHTLEPGQHHRRLPRKRHRQRARPDHPGSRGGPFNGERAATTGGLVTHGVFRVLARLYPRRMPGGTVRGHHMPADVPLPPVDVRRPPRRPTHQRAGCPSASSTAVVRGCRRHATCGRRVYHAARPWVLGHAAQPAA